MKKISKEELEKMSHLDIAYYIIKQEKKTYSTLDLLKKICDLLEYEDNTFESIIGDFYTSLNLDKRFILIDKKWDLAENHSIKIVVEDDVDDELEEYDDDIELEDENVEIEDEAVLDDTEALEDVEDDIDDDIEDLTVMTEEELDEEIE